MGRSLMSEIKLAVSVLTISYFLTHKNHDLSTIEQKTREKHTNDPCPDTPRYLCYVLHVDRSYHNNIISVFDNAYRMIPWVIVRSDNRLCIKPNNTCRSVHIGNIVDVDFYRARNSTADFSDLCCATQRLTQ